MKLKNFYLGLKENHKEFNIFGAIYQKVNFPIGRLKLETS